MADRMSGRSVLGTVKGVEGAGVFVRAAELYTEGRVKEAVSWERSYSFGAQNASAPEGGHCSSRSTAHQAQSIHCRIKPGTAGQGRHSA